MAALTEAEVQLIGRIVDRLRRTFQFYADRLRPDDVILHTELAEAVRQKLGPDWPSRRYADVYEVVKSAVDARLGRRLKTRRPDFPQAPTGVG